MVKTGLIAFTGLFIWIFCMFGCTPDKLTLEDTLRRYADEKLDSMWNDVATCQKLGECLGFPTAQIQTYKVKYKTQNGYNGEVNYEFDSSFVCWIGGGAMQVPLRDVGPMFAGCKQKDCTKKECNK